MATNTLHNILTTLTVITHLFQLRITPARAHPPMHYRFWTMMHQCRSTGHEHSGEVDGKTLVASVGKWHTGSHGSLDPSLCKSKTVLKDCLQIENTSLTLMRKRTSRGGY